MEISSRATIKTEEYKGYQDLARVRSSIALVQDRLEQGLLTRDQIWNRYTAQVCLELEDDEVPNALQNITECFSHLKDASDNLEQGKLKRFLHDVLAIVGAAEMPGAVDVLAKIFSWHAAYPFPMAYTQGPEVSPAIDEAGFIRAVALLNLEPRVSGAPRLTAPGVHGVSTNLDNPNFSLSVITHRGRDAHDFRRWLFRSLAVPKQGRDDCPLPPVLLSVPRLILTPESQRITDADPNDSKVWYMTTEDERRTDLLDVLADTMPGCRKPLPNPTRDKCELALPMLPQHELGLNELHVRPNIYNALIRLVHELKTADERQSLRPNSLVDPVASTPYFGLPAEIDLSWEEFNQKLETDGATMFIADGLDKVYRNFKMPKP